MTVDAPVKSTKASLKEDVLQANARRALAEARLFDSNATLAETALVQLQSEIHRGQWLDREAQANALVAELRVDHFKEDLKQEKFGTHAMRINADALSRAEATDLASNDQHHVYSYYDSINPESVVECMHDLTLWSRKAPECDMEIILHSPGGEVFAGMHLFDFLTKIKENHKLTITAVGMTASMAAILVQAGTVRRMGPQSYLMIHEISAGVQGTSSEVADRLALLKKMEKRILGVFAARSNLTERQISTLWKKNDVWMDSDECLEKGLIDEIL